MRVLFFVFVICASVFGGNVSLRHSDSLVTWYTSDSVFTTKFLGNVFVEHDDIDITSDEMNYVKIRDYFILNQNVVVKKETGEYFYSDSAKYYKNDKMVFAYGNILAGFTQDSLKIYGDSIAYYLDDAKKYGWVWKKPLALKINPTDSLKLVGDSIFVSRKDSVLKSISDVKISSGKNVIYSDSAIYHYSKDSVEILGKRPRVETTKDTLIGDFIYAKLKNQTNEIKRADILGDVKIYSSNEQKTEFNHIFGERVNAYFYDDKQNIDIVYINGTPNGIMIQEKGDSIYYSADSMAVNFNDSQSIKEIFLVGNSKYKMVKKDAQDDDTLEGDRLVIYFEKSEPVLAKVVNHASLESYSYDNRNTTINQISGDTIDVNFVEGQIDNIDFKGRIEGKIISIPK